MTKTPKEMAEEEADRIERQAILCVSLLAMNDGEYFAAKKAYKAGYQDAKDQLQPQPFHAGADVYVIDANHPLPKPMPLSIAEQEKPRFEFKPLEYCGDDEVLREMFSLPTNYWMTEQELKECGLQAVVADKLADTGKVMPEWISVKERLPDEGQEILWYHATGGEYCVGQLTDATTPPFFTHWMPLPTPPEE